MTRWKLEAVVEARAWPGSRSWPRSAGPCPGPDPTRMGPRAVSKTASEGHAGISVGKAARGYSSQCWGPADGYTRRLSPAPTAPPPARIQHVVFRRTPPQYRHRRPRRPWQDHPRRPAAQAVRHPERARRGPGPRHGQQRSRKGTWHHDPFEEHRDPLDQPEDGRGLAHQHRRHARATPTSAAKSSACCRWSTPC